MVRCIGSNRNQSKIWIRQTEANPNSVLWLQERVAAKELQLTKAVGTANPADMRTKNLAKADLDRHLGSSGLILRDGPADGSLQVAGVTCSSF